jgi:Mce-associated membrane protein
MGGRWRLAWAGIGVLLLAAVAAVGWAVWPRDSAADQIGARDEALRAGETGIASLTTVDSRNPDEGLDRWAATATGPLLDDLRRGRDGSRRQIVAGRSAMTGNVVDAALTGFDPGAGTATMIAAVEITVAPETGPPQVKQDRFTASLIRTGDGWKLASLGSVAAGAPVPAQGPAPFGAAETADVTTPVRRGLERIFSYSYDDLDATDRAAAEVLAGNAVDDYRKLIDQVRAQAPGEKLGLTTTAPVAGVRALDGGTARLLVFLDQTQTRDGAPAASTAMTVTVLAQRQSGAWKITELVPH